MNKKLIVLAIAGAISPLAALAEVTLYGRVAAEYGNVDIDQPTNPDANYRQSSISDNAGTSRWGLLISEDLGNGLKANARVEYGLHTGNGVPDNVREQWVGFSGKNWGALQFGRVPSPFKDFAGGGSLDPFNDTNLQARGAGGALYAPANGLGAASFTDHAIRYTSPSWGPFSMALLASPGDATQTEGTTGNGNIGGKGDNTNYQAGLKFKITRSGEIFGGYSHDAASDAQKAAVTNGVNGDNEKVWRLGTAWNFGNFRLAAQYDKIKNALAGNGGTTCSGDASINGAGDAGFSTAQCNTSLNANGEGDIWFLSTQYKLGQTTLVLQGGQTKADAVSVAGVVTANEREAKNLTAGAIYSLSKRTRVFGGYQRVSVEGARSVSNVQGAPGTTAGTVALATQPDRSTWSIGMRHDF